MNLELEKLLNRPVDLVIEGDLLPDAEKTANRDKVLVYARAERDKSRLEDILIEIKCVEENTSNINEAFWG